MNHSHSHIMFLHVSLDVYFNVSCVYQCSNVFPWFRRYTSLYVNQFLSQCQSLTHTHLSLHVKLYSFNQSNESLTFTYHVSPCFSQCVYQCFMHINIRTFSRGFVVCFSCSVSVLISFYQCITHIHTYLSPCFSQRFHVYQCSNFSRGFVVCLS